MQLFCIVCCACLQFAGMHMTEIQDQGVDDSMLGLLMSH